MKPTSSNLSVGLRRLLPHSLGGQLLLLLTLSVAAVMLITEVTIVWTLKGREEARFRSNAQQMGVLLSRFLREALYTNEFPKLRQRLEGIFRPDRHALLAVYDNLGTPLAWVGNPTLLYLQQDGWARTPAGSVFHIREEVRSRLSGKILGYLSIVYSGESLERMMQQTLLFHAIPILALFVVLMVLISTAVARGLRPLSNLAEAIREIGLTGSGTPRRLPYTDRRDEIGVLARVLDAALLGLVRREIFVRRLNRLIRDLLEVGTLDALFEKLAKESFQIFDIRGAAVLYPGANGHMRVENRAIPQEVLEKILSPDFPRPTEPQVFSLKEMGVQIPYHEALLVLPFKTPTGPAMFVLSGKGFDPETVEAGALLAEVLELLVSHRLFLERLKREHRRLMAMNTLDEILLTSPRLEELALRFLNGMRMVLPYDAALVVAFQDRGIRLLAHLPPEPSPPLQEQLFILSPGEEERAVRYWEDLHTAQGPEAEALRKLGERLGIRSLLVGVLRSRGPVLGFLMVGRARPAGFTSVEQETFTSLTRRLSLAWENLLQAAQIPPEKKRPSPSDHQPDPGRPSSSGGT